MPTEAEWEKAARGYGWPHLIRGGTKRRIAAGSNFSGKDGYCVENGSTAAVGSYPPWASPYGALDMAGNVWERVNDWYETSYYASARQARIRSGQQQGIIVWLAGAARNAYQSDVLQSLTGRRTRTELPGGSAKHLGFRCVQHPECELDCA